MRRLRFNFDIDWTSKIIDLLIVIIGITIAFQLNSWNEASKTNQKAQEYVNSFYGENKLNQENLVLALEFSKSSKNDIDTLNGILLSKDYSDERIKPLTSSMMVIVNYKPTTTTMQNISASGDFDLLKDIELRKKLIGAYNTYKTTTQLESILSDYINQYVTPYFFENVRFSDFSSIHDDFTIDPAFENIVIGYSVLLNQLVSGYEENLGKLELLNEKLTTANNNYLQ